jgi:hypothetical protein
MLRRRNDVYKRDIYKRDVDRHNAFKFTSTCAR